MALDRTWYNTLVDDDGSNTVGSVWNKASVDSLMDATDAEVARLETTKAALGAGVYLPLTGINNDYNPAGAATTTVWLLAPSAISYITGIPAPAVPGTQHLLINSGSPITLSNAHTGSADANRLTCPGYADYVLNSWYSVWLYYSNYFAKWIVLKP
jgi:hypothetical protein